MTSCSPEIVREVARFFAEKQVRLIDAPITGALPKAIDGTLTIMGAGDPAAFAAAEGVFSAISERVFQLGEIGNGKLIKAMTNLLGAINLAAVGEFYRFAQSAGLDMETLQQVVAVSAGGSTQFERNFNKMSQTTTVRPLLLPCFGKICPSLLPAPKARGFPFPCRKKPFAFSSLRQHSIKKTAAPLPKSLPEPKSRGSLLKAGCPFFLPEGAPAY